MVAEGAFTNRVGLSIAFNTRLMPLCRIFLHPFDLSFKLLRESTSYFGYNPRRCFEASLSIIMIIMLDVNRREVASVIKGAAGKANNIMQLLLDTRMGDLNVSHTIFRAVPIQNGCC